MYKIVISNQCDCYKKSDIENNLSFESKDEALAKAIQIKDFMNKAFCKKHSFEVQEMFNNFVIKFYKEEQKTYCCGNGCCM
ncbi:hypothetical protein [Aliarcobacter butzleri]|uniref:hypothetical protein n=1 Tax=Aliarcobacter butzleri TaxID=28197 RepID=UPI00189C8990|nr:hypothetical protein [Aliarcobacter butzleri]MBF7070760.1 hypothetical protein [Aliarcobacter butzleri]